MAKRKASRQNFRHENGFGSIVKLSGHRRKPFAVRITTGWKDGKQIRKYLGYYVSEAEALMALAEYHKNGIDLDLSKLTFGEVFEKWYSRIETKVSKKILNNHNMSRVRLGNLAKKPIKDIKVDHLQDWLDNIDLKPGTKHRLKSTMHQVFEYAVKNDILQKNPAKFLEINEKVEKTGAIFTDEEIKYLWDNSSTNVDIQTILILIYTGVRINELLKLKMDDLHLDESYAIGGSKTKAGKNRIIPFHDKILPIIKERIEKYNCVVPNTTGTPATYGAFHHRFTVMMDALGWEHKIHDTRKTAISIMHRSDIPMETIRMIVGHSAQGVTEQVYLYKEPKELVEAVNKIQIQTIFYKRFVACLQAMQANLNEQKQKKDPYNR